MCYIRNPYLIGKVCIWSIQEIASWDSSKVPTWKDETNKTNIYIATICWTKISSFFNRCLFKRSRFQQRCWLGCSGNIFYTSWKHDLILLSYTYECFFLYLIQKVREMKLKEISKVWQGLNMILFLLGGLPWWRGRLHT